MCFGWDDWIGLEQLHVKLENNKINLIIDPYYQRVIKFNNEMKNVYTHVKQQRCFEQSQCIRAGGISSVTSQITGLYNN